MSSPSLKEVVGKDSENASNSSSNGESGGNNSDNSALVSLGNTSFGFNFESDGVFNNSSGSNSPDEGDSDQGDRKPKADQGKMKKDVNTSKIAATVDTSATAANTTTTTATETSSESDEGRGTNEPQEEPQPQPQSPPKSAVATENLSPVNRMPMSAGAAAARIKSETMKPPPRVADSSSAIPGPMGGSVLDPGSHQNAAAVAVANLNQIATDAVKKTDAANEDGEKRGLKRKSDDDSGGYNTDDEGEKSIANSSVKNQSTTDSLAGSIDENCLNLATGKAMKSATGGAGGKKKKLDDSKREERNAREKERSFRISKQINELRSLLSSGGVIVPKGTKSSVLTEAANYIRMLQQHQYRSEIDRHQLVQQVQRIGSGALGQQAAQAVRHVAAQNGVWSLGNFGGVPPKSAMMYHQPSGGGGPIADETQSDSSRNEHLPNTIEEADYRHVFNSCTIGMAIASMGGAFIDCNKFFCQIANYTKQEICSMTIFNLTARQDLQSAFDLISQMLSAPLDPTVTNTSCVLRGALKHQNDVGLSVKLIKGNDGVAKCFCVTLIQNPVSPFDTSRPIPAAISIAGPGQVVPGSKDSTQTELDPTPAYTTG